MGRSPCMMKNGAWLKYSGNSPVMKGTARFPSRNWKRWQAGIRLHIQSLEEARDSLQQAIEMILEDRKADMLSGFPNDTLQVTLLR
jgi:hypothetical protein